MLDKIRYIEARGKFWAWPRYDVGLEKALLPETEQVLNYARSATYGPGPGTVAVVAGGACGVVPHALAEHFTQVITFEPERLNFQCLLKNIADRGNVHAYNAALSDAPGKVSMALEPRYRSNAGCHHAEPVDARATRNAVHCMPLDSLLLPELDFVVLDVEGYEFKALFGMRETLKRCKPLLIVETKCLHRYHRTKADVLDFLCNELDYTLIESTRKDIILR